MKAEEYYKEQSPYLWDSDKPQEDEGCFGKSDMIEFAEQHAKEEIIKALKYVTDGRNGSHSQNINKYCEDNNIDYRWK